MMKKCFLILWLALAANSVNLVAQPKSGYARIPFDRHTRYGKKTVVDTTRLVVLYALNADDLTNPDTYIDLGRLEVGRHSLKYCSEFVRQSDSLLVEWLKKNPNAQGIPNFLGNGGKKKTVWSEYEFSNLFFANGEATVYTTVPNGLLSFNYYKESYPSQTWDIGTEKTAILGHDCQKATTRWRGRTFTAWFAADIPAQAGPWKFGGLPGLILKVEDTDSLYRFEAVELSTQSVPMFRYEFKDYKLYTREKAWKLNNAVNENYYKVAGVRSVTFDASGEPIIGAPKSRYVPYEPLEKE